MIRSSVEGWQVVFPQDTEDFYIERTVLCMANRLAYITYLLWFFVETSLFSRQLVISPISFWNLSISFYPLIAEVGLFPSILFRLWLAYLYSERLLFATSRQDDLSSFLDSVFPLRGVSQPYLYFSADFFTVMV